MFGFFNRLRGPETRSAEIDVGSLYASVFGLTGGAYNFAQSPAILVSSLAVLDNAGALLDREPAPGAHVAAVGRLPRHHRERTC